MERGHGDLASGESGQLHQYTRKLYIMKPLPGPQSPAGL
jgi:hypothetical protein